MNILGNKFDSLSQIMELDIAQKSAINFDELIIAQLALLSSLLMLIGDMLILVSQLKLNQQTLDEGNKLKEYDFAETLSMWIYVLGDYLCLESSLLELKELKQTSQDK